LFVNQSSPIIYSSFQSSFPLDDIILLRYGDIGDQVVKLSEMWCCWPHHQFKGETKIL